MTIRKNELGTTGVFVSETGFGCAPIGNLFREVSDAQSRQVLQAAWDAGIRYFDTAPHYGRGLSEIRLGQFLTNQARGDYVISTKVGRVLVPGDQQSEVDGFIKPLPFDRIYDYSAAGIEKSLEDSRSRLGTDYMDIVFVHDIGEYTHGADNNAHLEAFLGSGYKYLVQQKEQGKIGAFGLGVNENQVCLDILNHGPLDVILLAGRLTLLDRSAEEQLVPLCQKRNTSLVLGGVFNSGILAVGPVDGATYDYAAASPKMLGRVSVLQETSEELGLPLATSALQFAKRHPMAASLLLGTSKPSSLQRNLDALAVKVPSKFDFVFERRV
jgi:D-threo-aldose 1-dehydrogenase